MMAPPPRLPDSFAELARYYDPIMNHVDYPRWVHVASSVAELLPETPQHLDAACGTGVLLEAVRRFRWNSIGVDLSPAMLRMAAQQDRVFPAAVADLRALPFGPSFNFITCLFDSLNFLLAERDVQRCLREFARVLRPGGLLYFDVITERMVLDYFDGRSWSENNGRFDSTWHSVYDRSARLSTTTVTVSSGADGVIKERVYSLDFIKESLDSAGLELIAMMDSDNFRAPRKRSTRIDIVAARKPDAKLLRDWRRLQRSLQAG